jgi:hypothetical protein
MLTRGSMESQSKTFQSKVGHGLNMPRPLRYPVSISRLWLFGAIHVIQLKNVRTSNR